MATDEPRSGPSPDDPPLAARPAPPAAQAEALAAPPVQRAPRDAAQKERAARWVAEGAEEGLAGDGRTGQASFLAVLPVRDGHEGPLQTILETIEAEDCETNHIIPFLRLHTVHFARFVLYDARLRRHVTQDKGAPGLLLFATDYDGSQDAHLDEVVGVAGAGLQSIFEHCQGGPAPGAGPAAVKAYLLAHQRPSNTFYSGTRRRSVLQIRREKRLRDCIEDYLDRERDGAVLRSGDPVKIREAVRAHVFAALPWAKESPGPYPTAVPTAAVAGLALLVLVGLPAAAWLVFGGVVTLSVVGALLLALLVSALHLRMLEATDREAPRPDTLKDHTSSLAAREDQIVQNQMTSVRRIKLGRFRLTLIRLVLWAIDKVARWLQVAGTLAGIPSIHFARWVILDEGRTLVFFSNFDGSWENYLGDFIDKSAVGLTAVWSNCIGFPATRWLVLGGARAERQFKDYTRDSQINTAVWYSAYKTLTVSNINANSFIRLGLHGDMNAEEARRWLLRL